MRTLRLLVLILVALSAEAGIFYRFNGVRRVWIDGDRKRIEIDPAQQIPREWHVSITVNGKTTFINQQNKTYYYPEDVSSGGISSRLFRLPLPTDSVKGKPKVTYRNDGAGPSISGHATTRHVIQFRYRTVARMHDVPVTGDFDATLIVVVASTLPRFDDEPLVTTSFPEIDEVLKKHLASIKGLVVGHELTVNRKIEDGPVVTEHISELADELKTIDVDPKLFEIPSGLTHQTPVIGVPGN